MELVSGMKPSIMYLVYRTLYIRRLRAMNNPNNKLDSKPVSLPFLLCAGALGFAAAVTSSVALTAAALAVLGSAALLSIFFDI